MSTPARLSLWLAAPVVSAALMIGCSSAGKPPPETVVPLAPMPSSAPDAELANPLPISPEDARIGPDDALVTLVLFGEIRNDWTAMLLEHYETEYAGALPPNTLRFVWKHHIEGDPGPVRDECYALEISAAAVFLAAGSKPFFDFVKRAAETKSLTAEQREELALSVGASREKYRASLPRAKARVDEDERTLSALPYPGPFFYVNGASENVRFSCDTSATLREELRLARESLAKGTPQDKVYAERVRANVAAKAHCVFLQD